MSTSLQSPHPTPPARPRPVHRRVVVAAALLVAASTGLLIAAVADRPAREPAAAGAGPEPIPAAPPLAGAPGGTAPTAVPTGTAVPQAPASSLLLWPFADGAQAASWQRAYRQGGHQPWHVDPAATALGFAGHLGYAGIDRAVRTTVDGRSAHVAVGFRAPDGSLHTAADVHLVKLGSGSDAPWEVVGTRDTTLTLTRPGYGTTVTSPLTVGGRVTGVDERITVRLYTLDGELPVGSVAGVPAGGDQAPWSVPVTFRAAPGAVLTVAAATGGHLAAVERFAVTGVRVGGTS